MLHIPVLPRSSFWLRIAVGAALVGLADLLFFAHAPGTSLGLFAFAVLGGALLGRKDLLQDRRSRGFVLAGVAFALVLADRPGVQRPPPPPGTSRRPARRARRALASPPST